MSLYPSPVIITGASSGIGRATALALAGRGISICIVARSGDKLEEVRKECLLAGAKACHAITIDLTHATAPEQVINETLEQFGEIGALINNAAVARFSLIEEQKIEDWELLLATNLLAPARLISCAIPALRKSRGCIVNISSIGGVVSLPGRSLYGASKAAFSHLTRSLARELAPDIRVNAILPGAVDTEIYDSLSLDASAVNDLRRVMVETTPLKRMGHVDDIVPWIEMLLSDAGLWVTGSLMVVDGGRSC